MGSVNKVTLLGRVGKDPEIRSFNNGGKVANFSIATSEKWKDRQTGEKREKTEWHKIAVFGDGPVGIIERFVKKGSQIYIEGKLQTRKWQDRDGNDKYTTEVVLQGFGGKIVLLDSQGSSNGGGYGGQSSGYGSAPSSGQGGEGPAESFDLDDEIPF